MYRHFVCSILAIFAVKIPVFVVARVVFVFVFALVFKVSREEDLMEEQLQNDQQLQQLSSSHNSTINSTQLPAAANSDGVEKFPKQLNLLL